MSERIKELREEIEDHKKIIGECEQEIESYTRDIKCNREAIKIERATIGIIKAEIVHEKEKRR